MIDVIKIIFSFAKIYIFYSYLYIFLWKFQKREALLQLQF